MMVVLGMKDLEKRWKSVLSVDGEKIPSLMRDNTGLMRDAYCHYIGKTGKTLGPRALALALALLEDAENAVVHYLRLLIDTRVRNEQACKSQTFTIEAL